MTTPPSVCQPYFCPSGGETECCPKHSGFDTCCDAPERHIPLAEVEAMLRRDGDMLAHYSAALDEIRRLRQALAYEAAVTAAHLNYATFPKSRRAIAAGQVERMRAAARGETRTAYADVSHLSLRHALGQADAPTTLTRSQWEEGR